MVVAAQSVTRVLTADLPAGVVVYHGPRDEVLPFFESCGFKIPGRKAVPDFLQEVWHQCFVQRFAALCPSSLQLKSFCHCSVCLSQGLRSCWDCDD